MKRVDYTRKREQCQDSLFPSLEITVRAASIHLLIVNCVDFHPSSRKENHSTSDYIAGSHPALESDPIAQKQRSAIAPAAGSEYLWMAFLLPGHFVRVQTSMG